MEVKTKKLLVEHVETISSSEAAKDVLQSYLVKFEILIFLRVLLSLFYYNLLSA